VIEVGEERYESGPGDSLLAPRKVAHVWAYVGEGTGRPIAALQPAGEIEALFDNLATLGSGPEREALRRVFSSHGMEVAGPPLPIARPISSEFPRIRALLLGSSLSSDAARRFLQICYEALEDGIGDAPLEAPQRFLTRFALRHLLAASPPVRVTPRRQRRRASRVRPPATGASAASPRATGRDPEGLGGGWGVPGGDSTVPAARSSRVTSYLFHEPTVRSLCPSQLGSALPG
jgi:hypothetical protein